MQNYPACKELKKSCCYDEAEQFTFFLQEYAKNKTKNKKTIKQKTSYNHKIRTSCTNLIKTVKIESDEFISVSP